MEQGADVRSHRASGLRRTLVKLRAIAEQVLLDAPWSVSGVDSYSLFLQLGLHMPRFQGESASQDQVIYREAMRLRDRLASIRSNQPSFVMRGSHPLELQDLSLVEIPEDVARLILEQYHYLMSFRSGSTHLGLSLGGDKWPVVLISLSSFDLTNLYFMRSDWTESAMVLSRVYAFPGAPRNAISYGLGKVRNWLKTNRPEVTALITYCNPNLGFTGTSYRADNWSLLGYERCTRYTYLDNNYVTDRRIVELFGKRPEELPNLIEGHAITFSQWDLEPLRLYLRGVSRTDLVASDACWFERWKPVTDQ